MDKKAITFWVLLVLVILILLIVFSGGNGNKKDKENSGKGYNFVGLNDLIPNIDIKNIVNKIDNGNFVNNIQQPTNTQPVAFYSKQKTSVERKEFSIRENIDEDLSSFPTEQSNTYCTEDSTPDDAIDVTPFLPAQFTTSLTGDKWLDSRNRSKPESICKKTLQKIYGVKFSTVRPTWLRNPKTNRPMELDCYNEDLKVAVEYNGAQHYKWPNFTRQTKQQWLDQVERDRLKVDICDQNGVYLITVPYNIPNDLIPDYINYYLPHNVERRQKYGMVE